MADLKLLGGAAVRDDSGRRSGISSRRYAVALLALLATAPSRTMSRGKLVGLLWPEVPEKKARNRLTSCVYTVRRELGDDVLGTVGEDLRLERRGLGCDVLRFDEAMDAERFDRAAEIYAGPFLDGFRLGSSSAFEHRVDRVRARLEERYERALEALAEEAEARGEPGEAAGWWRKRAARDPYDSRVAARLMEALCAASNRADALRVFREHAERLEEEFGTEPDAEVHRVVERIRAPAVSPTDPTEEAGALPPRALAVLPFENVSGSDEAEPFAAGLQEDLLTELSRISALTVISRSSVVGYRGAGRSIREIARELGVGTVVEGAVQSAGGRVRLNVQLTDARSGEHRWVERFDRELSASNIFEIQSELAGKIARTLKAELTPEERERVGREPTADLEAYRLYIQGRGLLDQRTSREMYRAVDYFSRAIEKDADYALAWSGLADALSLLEFYDHPRPPSAPDALDAARRAVDLGPELGQTRAALGIVHSVRRQGRAARRELERAVELRPSYAEAHGWLGWMLLVQGRPERALEAAARAAELDPLAPAFRVYLAETLLALGRKEEALREARRAREIRPGYGLVHFIEGLALHHLGKLDEARAAFERALPLVPPGGTPSHTEIRAALAVTRAATGDMDGAREFLVRIRGAGDSFSRGLVHAALGEADAALELFEEIEEWGSFATDHIRYFFPEVLGPLRDDPRFGAILRAVDRSWQRGPGSGGDD